VHTEMVSKLMRRFKKFFPKMAWEEIDKYFHFTEKENLFCEYCNTKLEYNEPYPYPNMISLDHKTPLSMGGLNSFENLAICCTRCNIVKGTMLSKTFIKFHELLNQNLAWKEKIMGEMFWGRRANAIQRKKKAERKKTLDEFI